MSEFSLIETIIKIAVVLGVILGTNAYLILLERKISAWMQDRLGPNRVGPYGLLQPIADGLKFLFKEEVIPGYVDRFLYLLAPTLAVSTALLAFAVVPFGPTTVPPPPGASAEEIAAYNDTIQFVIAPRVDIGILFVFAIGSLNVYGVILGGWAANNKYSFLGALRSSAQLISYEIPLGLSVLGVLLFTGSLNLERIIQQQVDHGWNIWYQPLAFVIFLTAVFAECNRLPFDLPEAEQELVGGYHTEYSGLKFALFFLGEYTHMITTSFLLAILFFGGWSFFGISGLEGFVGGLLKVLVLLAKVAFFIVFYMLIRWTIPRFRFDQLMAIAWKAMIPLALANLVITMVIMELGWSRWLLLPLTLLPIGVVGWLALRNPAASRRMARPLTADEMVPTAR